MIKISPIVKPNETNDFRSALLKDQTIKNKTEKYEDRGFQAMLDAEIEHLNTNNKFKNYYKQEYDEKYGNENDEDDFEY